MVAMPHVPNGCQVIPLWRNVSRDNFHPQHIIVGYTIVEDSDFQWLNQDRWFMVKDPKTGACYAFRVELQGGKTVTIQMSREILGLHRNPGCRADKADHINHNTLDNRKSKNLRIANRFQSAANVRIYSTSQQRFKDVYPDGNYYGVRIQVDGSRVKFYGMLEEVEAGQVSKYAAIIMHDKFACYTEIPPDEVPSRERRWELMGMVVEKFRQKGFLV